MPQDFSLPIVANADSYTVKSGDTLSAIAKEEHNGFDAIAKKNKISNVNLISWSSSWDPEDENHNAENYRQAPAKMWYYTSSLTTVSASDGLNAEDTLLGMSCPKRVKW